MVSILVLVAFLLVCDFKVYIGLDQHKPLHRDRNRPWGLKNRTLFGGKRYREERYREVSLYFFLDIVACFSNLLVYRFERRFFVSYKENDIVVHSLIQFSFEHALLLALRL